MSRRLDKCDAGLLRKEKHSPLDTHDFTLGVVTFLHRISAVSLLGTNAPKRCLFALRVVLLSVFKILPQTVFWGSDREQIGDD